MVYKKKEHTGGTVRRGLQESSMEERRGAQKRVEEKGKRGNCNSPATHDSQLWNPAMPEVRKVQQYWQWRDANQSPSPKCFPSPFLVPSISPLLAHSNLWKQGEKSFFHSLPESQVPPTNLAFSFLLACSECFCFYRAPFCHCFSWFDAAAAAAETLSLGWYSWLLSWDYCTALVSLARLGLAGQVGWGLALLNWFCPFFPFGSIRLPLVRFVILFVVVIGQRNEVLTIVLFFPFLT